MLKIVDRPELSDHDLEGLVTQLISVALWHRQREACHYNLSPAEIRRALAVGPPAVRQNAAWQLWRLMGQGEGPPPDKAERWQRVIGPIFRDIWPLDAGLRSKETAQNLVFMALECEGAFPDAVDAIVDFLVPYQLYELSMSLRLEQKHSNLVRRAPRSFRSIG